jgi:hypothetical protein
VQCEFALEPAHTGYLADTAAKNMQALPLELESSIHEVRHALPRSSSNPCSVASNAAPRMAARFTGALADLLPFSVGSPRAPRYTTDPTAQAGSAGEPLAPGTEPRRPGRAKLPALYWTGVRVRRISPAGTRRSVVRVLVLLGKDSFMSSVRPFSTQTRGIPTRAPTPVCALSRACRTEAFHGLQRDQEGHAVFEITATNPEGAVMRVPPSEAVRYLD